MRHIVLVESPNKREKILSSLEKEFPKDSWVVLATYGHIKYLPKTEYGLKFTGSNFYSDFKEMESWGKTKKEISEMLKSSRYETDIYIATDGDREGEVIAFQIVESLGLESMKIQYHRVIFNALSHQAIVDAFKNPVKFNRHFYYAGIVRRVIDRDIGYLISSFMYDDFRERYGEEIASGIGRVSAPSLSILAKKHFQRESFIEAKYRKIVVEYLYNGNRFTALGVNQFEEHQFDVAESICNIITMENNAHEVADFESKREKIYPPTPLDNTSLLYASWYLNRYNEKETMELAQSLFEKGYITYHRSDSVALCEQTARASLSYIYEHIDENLATREINLYAKKSGSNSQEGHEAIVPVHIEREYSPEFLLSAQIKSEEKGYVGGMATINEKEWNLYRLIWNRTIASQMQPGIVNVSELTIVCAGHYFIAKGKKIIEKGWLDFFGEHILKSTVGNSDFLTRYNSNEIHPIEVGRRIYFTDVKIHDQDKERPKRLGRGQFIQAISAKGIGRPSTLYSIPNELVQKGYAKSDEDGIFDITDNGLLVMDWILEVVPELVEEQKVAGFEEMLNEIAIGKRDYVKMVLNYHQWIIEKAAFFGFKTSLISRGNDFITQEEQDFRDVIKKIEEEKGIIAGDDLYVDREAAMLFIKHHTGMGLAKNIISQCPICEGGEIAYEEKTFLCDKCDFRVGVGFIQEQIGRFGKQVDEVFVERELKKALVSQMPIGVNNLTSKKGRTYNAKFTFVKTNDEWGIEFYVEKEAESNVGKEASEIKARVQEENSEICNANAPKMNDLYFSD